MKHLKLDRRGFPIPWGVYIDQSGKPFFTLNDLARHKEIQKRDLCPICGTKLFRGRWFVGGPGAAFMPTGAYLDPPMHSECAHYALKVCPFIAAPKFKRLGEKLIPSDGVIMVDQQADDARPLVFVAVMTTKQMFFSGKGYFKPLMPYSGIEFWREGEQLEGTTGWELCLQNSPEIAEHVRRVA